MFVVIEIQASDKVATLVNAYEDRNQAESKFHTILGAAATSKVPIHSAVLMTDTGKTLKAEHYEHNEEAEA